MRQPILARRRWLLIAGVGFLLTSGGGVTVPYLYARTLFALG